MTGLNSGQIMYLTAADTLQDNLRAALLGDSVAIAAIKRSSDVPIDRLVTETRNYVRLWCTFGSTLTSLAIQFRQWWG